MRSVSMKSRKRKSCTSSSFSGPPIFNIRIPVLGFLQMKWMVLTNGRRTKQGLRRLGLWLCCSKASVIDGLTTCCVCKFCFWACVIKWFPSRRWGSECLIVPVLLSLWSGWTGKRSCRGRRLLSEKRTRAQTHGGTASDHWQTHNMRKHYPVSHKRCRKQMQDKSKCTLNMVLQIKFLWEIISKLINFLHNVHKKNFNNPHKPCLKICMISKRHNDYETVFYLMSSAKLKLL